MMTISCRGKLLSGRIASMRKYISGHFIYILFICIMYIYYIITIYPEPSAVSSHTAQRYIIQPSTLDPAIGKRSTERIYCLHYSYNQFPNPKFENENRSATAITVNIYPFCSFVSFICWSIVSFCIYVYSPYYISWFINIFFTHCIYSLTPTKFI